MMSEVSIHPSAQVATGATIGAGTKIWVNAQIREDTIIGSNCIISKDAYIDNGVRVGDGVKVQNGVSVYSGVTLEDRVFVGPNATFTNDRVPRAFSETWQIMPTVIKTGASIGANATIICGVTVGEYAMVAAGSVVTKDVAPHSLVMGNPARHVCYIDESGTRRDRDAGEREDLRIGLIGLGYMGRNHLRVLSLLKNMQIGFIYDTDQPRAAQLAAEFGVTATNHLERELDTVDALVVASPTSTHAEYIKMAASHVKYIFVEKPLTDQLESAEEVSRLAQENGIGIQVGFIERFNPALATLKGLLDSNRRIVNVDFTRTNKISSRITDVDVISDLMIHDIDLACYLNGPTVDVVAYGTAESGQIAFARATLFHANGTFSNLTASRITEKRIRQIVATCEDSYIDCNLLRKEIVVSRQSAESAKTGPSITATEETIEVQPQEALLNELINFRQFCLGQDVDVPVASDGLSAIRIAEQVRETIVKSL
jgi:predicted dehydrogenase/acetyltransferase-like isoleucine patch superfamily enzyme